MTGARLTWALAVGIGVSFTVAVVASLMHADVAAPSHEATAFSESAVGYGALVDLLRAEGLTVEVSRTGSATRVGPRRPLLVVEPPAGSEAHLGALAAGCVERGAALIVALPRWRGAPDPDRPTWVDSVRPVDADVAAMPLRALLDVDDAAEWIARPGAPPREGYRWPLDGPAVPSLDAPQLIAGGSTLEPVVESPAGALVAWSEDLQLLVIADPDLLNNQGLHRGDNALLVVRLLTEGLEADGVVIDETIHGYTGGGSLWAELTRLPLVLVLVHLGLLGLVVAWRAGLRIGRTEQPPPRIPPGKGALVENTAQLLVQGGHHAHSLQRYLRANVAAAAAACAVSPGLPPEEQRRILAAIGMSRGVTEPLEALDRDVASALPRSALEVARRIYRWRREITHAERAHDEQRRSRGGP